ncbi:alpha/beta family hydrolase [Pseudobacteriovorax antillogorgiicola]|uniref:KANL3/Tex30 alpha/beta hydrolase-like domain-containing protein n=1 Tax=Pseudobacteriovorax antillogorgiicola TaxID=1513793 RepID=A0A1Y6BJE7_9BACT|nr:alpha/beta family hydrolase [Pseudobacteriovorax antillogorgiicola]TCS55331.1 hypothetical protein EDD56_10552 [Pseudobacteriovorax antillogorgiicola]SMF14067.1 hypothetical protein SAMN06296036_105272 [Pseudobacteriovorax antillogorgiicola]
MQSKVTIHIPSLDREVSGLLNRPRASRAVILLAHGAGAGMDHPFMEALTEQLNHNGLASLRYQFPYMDDGRKRPDHKNKLLPTIAAAISWAEENLGDVPLFLGGKSMGGRMSSLHLSETPNPAVRGLIFFGFPLHPAGKEGTVRGDHLKAVEGPMLFLQGDRDALAQLSLMKKVVAGLGTGRRMVVIKGADHSFKTLKRSGVTADEVLERLAREASAFVADHL